MDVDTFLRVVDRLAFDTTVFALDDLLKHIGGVLDLIQGPSLLLSGDLLFHGGQETLRIEESCEPERWRSLALGDPDVELIMSVEKTLNPSREGSGQP